MMLCCYILAVHQPIDEAFAADAMLLLTPLLTDNTGDV